MRLTDSNYAPLTVSQKNNGYHFASLAVTGCQKYVLAFQFQRRRKWRRERMRRSGSGWSTRSLRPGPDQSSFSSRFRRGSGRGRCPWWRGRCSTLYSRSSWSTCIPKYPPQDGLPLLSSDAVIANDRDSIWTLNYSRYFLLRESLLFGRP